MTLKEWLDAKGLKPADFAPMIGRTAEAVRRYAAGERIPDRDTMPRIVEETDGEVTPNDFFSVDTPPPFRTSPRRHRRTAPGMVTA